MSAVQERLRDGRQDLIVIAAVVSPIVTAIIATVVAIVSVGITVIVPIRPGACPLIAVAVIIIRVTPKLGYRDAPVTVVIRGSHETVRTLATEFSNQLIEGQNTIGVGINGPETGRLSRRENRAKRGN